MNQAATFNANTAIHANVIQNLAERYDVDEAMVKTLYEVELGKLLKEGVRITSFLPVLCARHVKEMLIISRGD